MIFDRAWVLPFTLVPLLWMFWELRQTRRRTALILKGLAFVAIGLALAEPRLTTSESKMAVAVLVDTSASIREDDLLRESQLATSIENNRGRHLVRVIPFAQAPRNSLPSEHPGQWRFEYTATLPTSKRPSAAPSRNCLRVWCRGWF
jgi:hypothetical protein